MRRASVIFVVFLGWSCRGFLVDPSGPEKTTLDAGAPSVLLPLEVLGPAGTVVTAAFDLPSLPTGGIHALYVRTHGLNYQAAGSVQINSGEWIALNNANPAVTVLGAAARYGGIGGAFVTLKLNIALTGNELTAGHNVISFRFNGTEGRSVGYRVLEFNVLDGTGTSLLPGTLFAQEDPATWTPPLPSAADIQAGHDLWSSGTLVESPANPSHTLLGHCMDCHSQDGRDLKYFNYSNNSIIQRAMFHGLTQQQGQQIASFIRSNESPNPGRVWNPPFQPGPGADAVPLSDWSAGMGIDAVLDSDAEIQPYLPGAGTNRQALDDPQSSGMSFARLNMRETPLAIQLLDWNHWLPAVSPADALGSVAAFSASPAFQTYQQIRTQLSANLPQPNISYIEGQLLNDSTAWYLARTALLNQSTAVNGSGTETAFVDNYALVAWSAQKMWEIVQEFDLQGVGQQLYGLSGERASWFISNRFVFDVSPHGINNVSGAPDLTTFQIFGDKTLGNTCPKNSKNATGACRVLLNDYVAANWYDVQMQVNPGSRRSAMAVHQVIDWGYMKNFENVGVNTGSVDAMRLARFTFKAMDELDTGLGPDNTAWGWNYRDELTEFLRIADDVLLPNDWTSNPSYASVVATAYQAWFEKSARFHLSTWQTVQGTSYDGENLPPSDYVIGAGNWPPSDTNKGDCLNRSFVDQYVAQLPALRALGLPAALVNGMVEFGVALYPNNNWSIYRGPISTALAAPIGVTAVATGAEQITVAWSAVTAAHSYNVKRATTPGGPFVTIAYFVDGTSFVDRWVQPGNTYSYVVSANTEANADEGASSSPAVSAQPNTGLISKWNLGTALQPGDAVPDVAATAPVNSGRVFQTPSGMAYVSVSQNLTRWLGGSATMTAWVQLPSGFTGTGSTFALPALAGSSGRTNQSFGYGLINSTGKVGGAVAGCDSTTNGQPVYSNVAVNDGSWHFVAIARDASTGTVQIYVDGTLSASGASGAGTCEGISRSLGRIDSATTGRAWPGTFKDVRVYDSVLSASAVAAVFHGT